MKNKKNVLIVLVAIGSVLVVGQSVFAWNDSRSNDMSGMMARNGSTSGIMKMMPNDNIQKMMNDMNIQECQAMMDNKGCKDELVTTASFACLSFNDAILYEWHVHREQA